MILKCKNCKHEWDYNGKSLYYATCPACHYKVRVERLPRKTKNGILLDCKCKYAWVYKGKLDIARCPNCNARVKVNR